MYGRGRSPARLGLERHWEQVMTALLIDDSKFQRSIVRLMLAQLGFSVCEAANGREGIAALDRIAEPDLILVDINMPVMDGLEFTQAVRAKGHTNPVVIMSAEDEVGSAAPFCERESCEFLIKPFDLETLQNTLLRLSDGKRLGHANLV